MLLYPVWFKLVGSRCKFENNLIMSRDVSKNILEVAYALY